jgi:hypothetical protein
MITKYKYIYIYLVNKYCKWNGFEQHIMTYFSGCVYAAGFRKANEKNCNLQEKDI